MLLNNEDPSVPGTYPASPATTVAGALDAVAYPDNPGLRLRHLYLDRQVVSCESAAAAKGVALEHELKSLLITCDHGHVVAHVRGSRRLSLRAVKRALAVQQARLAGPLVLSDLELLPGTIHPFHPRLWQMVHLVTCQVLAMPWVTTNAGQLESYVVFDPQILRNLGPIVENFEE
jgi:prolyl-tRNA editing enzyme YbaK/EbsC (Cys-tRNA(Pro) deacylase)